MSIALYLRGLNAYGNERCFFEEMELLFYKCIGVLYFKKIVLSVEEILHVNRGYRLMNYHPEKMTVEGINDFFWLVIYNSTLHIMSIVLLLLYYLFEHIGKIRIVALDIIVLIMIIFNLYCIFLQRYTYLRLQQLLTKTENMLKKQYQLKMAKIDEMSPIRISEEMYDKTLKLIDRVEGVFLKENSCFINDDDLYVLEHMKNMLCEVDMKFRTNSFSEKLNVVSIDGGIRLINPCKRVNMIVGILKYLLNRKIYFENKKSIVLVTETDECEVLYSAVFGDESTEIELLRIKLLREIYMNKVQVE